jgi:hypothetical protein
MIGNYALAYRVATESSAAQKRIEASMATQRQHQIVETPTEARQAEPGPSVLALLAVSTGLAVLILGILWFVFFRT